jgi:hypothetical protein
MGMGAAWELHSMCELALSQLISWTDRFLEKQVLLLPLQHVVYLTMAGFLLSFDIFFCVSFR